MKIYSYELVKQNIEKMISFILMLVFAFVFLLYSPLHPFINGYSGTDSSVFRTISVMIENGFMPYRDSFDHKGPLIYLLNYAGNLISYRYGIWIIELIFMTITFYLMYRISRFFCSAFHSVCVFLVSLILLFSYFGGGNFVEEYAMTFISIALFIFIDYFKNEKITKIRLIICGMSLAGILMLRPNMIAVWIVMCISALYQLLRKKEYIQILQYLIWFLIGITIVIVPIIVWLWNNDSLGAFWQDYIVFNGKYISEGKCNLLKERIKSFLSYSIAPVFLISFLLQIRNCYLKKSLLDISYLVMMAVSQILICISGVIYDHYGMVVVPIVIYPLAKTVDEINSFELENKMEKSILALLGILVFGMGFSTYLHAASDVLDKCRNENDVNKTNVVREICNTLNELNIGENEKISVYGNWNIIYLASNRLPATKYSYQFPIGEVNPEIMDEYYNELEEELPKAVIIQDNHYDEKIKTFLKENDYVKVWQQKESIQEGSFLFVRSVEP